MRCQQIIGIHAGFQTSRASAAVVTGYHMTLKGKLIYSPTTSLLWLAANNAICRHFTHYLIQSLKLYFCIQFFIATSCHLICDFFCLQTLCSNHLFGVQYILFIKWQKIVTTTKKNHIRQRQATNPQIGVAGTRSFR